MNLDFDKYYEAPEPGRRERAYAWATAIGLQDVDGLDVRGLHGRKVASGHAVDDVQGLGASAEGTDTTELNIIAVLRGVVTAVLDDVEAGHLTLEKSHGVGDGALVEIVCFQGCNGSGHFFLGL